MPRRGYRKGITDGRQPLPRQVYARFSDAEYAALKDEAALRGMTVSRLMRVIAGTHLTGRRSALPHPQDDNHALVRELARIGNNLNQLAKQANTGLVTVSEPELLSHLAALNAAVRRI